MPFAVSGSRISAGLPGICGKGGNFLPVAGRLLPPGRCVCVPGEMQAKGGRRVTNILDAILDPATVALMLGGMVTAPLLSLFVIPAAYVLMRKPRKRDQLDSQVS